MSEWQPISTAPRDGTRVLLGYSEGDWIGAWVSYSTVSNGGYRLTFDEMFDGVEPTHWAPLPEPPKVESPFNKERE